MPNEEEKNFKCPSCNEIFSASKWDEATKKNCLNRKLRRLYVSIQLVNPLHLKWYECPGCGKQHYNRDIKVAR